MFIMCNMNKTFHVKRVGCKFGMERERERERGRAIKQLMPNKDLMRLTE